jgi:hypothetical protein
VRRFLPELIDLIWNRQINPGKVFDLELPLDQSAEGIGRWTSGGRSRSSFAYSRVTATNGRSLPIERGPAELMGLPAGEGSWAPGPYQIPWPS